MHLGWKKMITNKVLSEISHKKLISHTKKIKFDVAIENRTIFEELGMVFENIEGNRRLFIKLFEDMDKFNFSEASSVTTNDVLLSDYGEIKLYRHTINTFREMLKIVNSEMDKEILLLIALLHDFGKSSELCSHYKITKEDRHWVRSAHYFTNIIESDQNNYELDESAIKIIANTLSIHHESLLNKSQQENRYLVYLKKADAAARKLEKTQLDKKA